DVLQPNPIFEQRTWVELDAYRRQGGAADVDFADTFDLQQLLLDDGGGRIVDLPRCERLGGQRQGKYRRVRRVVLAIARIRAQRCGQVGACALDRRLHVARRAVDVAAHVELQHDARGAHRALGGHLGDPRDGTEVPFQRSEER